MSSDAGEKTEAPTPRRLTEAREKGQVARSTDLTAAAGLLAGLAMLKLLGGGIMDRLARLMQDCLQLERVPVRAELLTEETLWAFVTSLALAVGPFLLVVFLVAIVSNVAQVGFLLSGEPLMPSFDRISPLKGFGRLFSMRTTVRMTMNLAKVGIIAAVAVSTITGFLPSLVQVAGMSFTEVFQYGAHLIYVLGMRIAVVLLVLAIIDYAFQRFKHNQDLRMSRQEVREELKRMEGDPTMRQRRRAVARQLANQRMGQAVPRADVVVTNPTHLAIALKYDPKTDPAPKVVARGADYMARRIRQIANEHGVPIVERKPLARALYKSCQVGDYVPPALYKAAAEVLAYVFELAGKGYRHRARSA